MNIKVKANPCLRKGVFVKKTKAMATTGKDGRGKWLDATRQLPYIGNPWRCNGQCKTCIETEQ